MTRIQVAACLVLLLFGACTEDSAPVDFNELEVVTEDDGCGRDAAPFGERSVVAELTADIDGNGVEDRVTLQTRLSNPEGCQAFVVADVLDEAGNGVVVSEPIWESGSQGGLPQPRLNSAVEITGQPGLEILVDEMSGASTQFVGAFTFVDGTLERIEAPEATEDIWSGAAEGVFPYGGSVGHIEGADCHADGGIVVSAALPAGPAANTYVVVRRYFDIEGAELTLRDTERPIATAKEVFEDFPEFRASPFGSCPNN